MKQTSHLVRLYLLNAALLITHEIDSAYWKEWELFGIPGGIQVFLVLNFALVLFVLYGFQCLVRGQTRGKFFSWLIVAGGFFAVIVHGSFLWLGYPQFRLPVSLGLLAAILLVTIAQMAATARRKTGGIIPLG